MLKLNYPFDKKFTVGQPFSKNYNTYYKEDGLLGHTGFDMNAEHGSIIYAATDAYCYSIVNKDNPDLMRYRCVYTIVDDEAGGVSYEVSYGHLGTIYAEKGTYLKVGDKIGTQGNTGDVASGGVKITKAMKLAGSTAGSHLHFQVRLLKKVDKKETGKKYLMPTKINGAYYEIPYYTNGFKGCVDPEQFFNGRYAVSLVSQIMNYFSPKITMPLRYGSRGDQVKLLQQKLGIKPDGIFGKGTEQKVKEFQKEKNLVVDGIVGVKTLSYLQQ